MIKRILLYILILVGACCYPGTFLVVLLVVWMRYSGSRKKK